jgi:hypothetical protein
MAYVTGHVYDPPSPDLPYLAVLLNESQVVASKAFKTPASARAFLATIVPQLQSKIDADKNIAKPNKKRRDDVPRS